MKINSNKPQEFESLTIKGKINYFTLLVNFNSFSDEPTYIFNKNTDTKIENYFKDEAYLIDIFHKFYNNASKELVKEDFTNLKVTDEHVTRIIRSRKGHYYLVGKFAISMVVGFIYTYRRSKTLRLLGLMKNNYLTWGGFLFYVFFGMGIVEKRLNQKLKEDISDILVDINFCDELKGDDEEMKKTKIVINNKIKHYKNFNSQMSMMNNFKLKV